MTVTPMTLLQLEIIQPAIAELVFFFPFIICEWNLSLIWKFIGEKLCCVLEISY